MIKTRDNNSNAKQC